MANKEVFTVSPKLIPRNKSLHFDLYINSSARDGVDRFICIHRAGSSLRGRDIEKLKDKFGHIYIAEDQRSLFLADLGDNDNLDSDEKVDVLKDCAIEYMNQIFQRDPKEFTTESLRECLVNCDGAIHGMLDSIRNYDVFGLHDLIARLDFHDHYTLDHSINTALYNMMLFREINPNATEEQLRLAGLGGMFHDIGKIHLPNSIINATEALTDEQYLEIKKHPSIGKDLLSREGIDFRRSYLGVIGSVVYEHHENFNGTGYPNGLKGEQINIFARMTAISDFFDAITTKRSYHHPLDPIDALAVIENSCGKKVDPYLFSKFKKRILKDERLDSHLCLPDNFDPCCPHHNLPFQLEDDVIPASKIEEKKEEENSITYSWAEKTQLPKSG